MSSGCHEVALSRVPVRYRTMDTGYRAAASMSCATNRDDEGPCTPLHVDSVLDDERNPSLYSVGFNPAGSFPLQKQLS